MEYQFAAYRQVYAKGWSSALATIDIDVLAEEASNDIENILKVIFGM